MSYCHMTIYMGSYCGGRKKDRRDLILFVVVTMQECVMAHSIRNNGILTPYVVGIVFITWNYFPILWFEKIKCYYGIGHISLSCPYLSRSHTFFIKIYVWCKKTEIASTKYVVGLNLERIFAIQHLFWK